MCGTTNTTGSNAVTLTMQSTLKQLDDVTAQLSAALRREEVLREAAIGILALTENQPIEEAGYLANWVFRPSRGGAVDGAIRQLRAALSACDEGGK